MAVLLLAAGLALGLAVPVTAQPAAPALVAPGQGDWIAIGPPQPAPVLGLMVDPSDDDTLYLLTGAGLRVSRDGGTTWKEPTLPGACALASSAVSPARLYAVTAERGGNLRLWRSDDQGRRWHERAAVPWEATPGASAAPLETGTERATGEVPSPGLDSRTAQPPPRSADARLPDACRLAVDAADPDVVVLASYGAEVTSDSLAAASPDAAANPVAVRLGWSRDGGAGFEALPAPPFIPLELLFTRDGDLLAAAADGVWRSADRGRSWQPARQGLESPRRDASRAIVRLAASAARPQVLYAGAEAEAGAVSSLFASRDGGETWQAVAGDLPAGDVAALLAGGHGGAADANDLVVAIAGAGLWHRADGRWSPLPPLPDSAEPVALAWRGDAASDLLVATASGELWRRAPPPPPCVDDATSLCLAGRFRVTLDAWTAGGAAGPGQAVPLTATSGWFWTTSPEAPAAAVRVVDVQPVDAPAGGSADTAGPWWIYWSGLGDDGFDLHVTDTVSGASSVYRQTPGTPTADRDASSFQAAEGRRGVGGRDSDGGLWLASLPEGGCGDDSPDLCLGDGPEGDREDGIRAGRFRVAVDWEDGSQHAAGVGDRLSPEAGCFRFSTTGDAELFVRVVDGRAVNGSWWVVFGGITEAAYEIRVSDETSGQTVAYAVSAGEPTAHADRQAFGDD